MDSDIVRSDCGLALRTMGQLPDCASRKTLRVFTTPLYLPPFPLKFFMSVATASSHGTATSSQAAAFRAAEGRSQTSSLAPPPVAPASMASSALYNPPSATFPSSNNRGLQHTFLGVSWRFLETDSNRPETPPEIKFDVGRTLYSRTSPRKSNGLVPEEPDQDQLILDRLALDILNDEDEAAHRKAPVESGMRKNVLEKIINMFQDGGDDRFVRRLRDAAKAKEESDLALHGVADDALAFAESSKKNEGAIENVAGAFRNSVVKNKSTGAKEKRMSTSLSLDEKVAKTLETANKFSRAGIKVSGYEGSEITGDTQRGAANAPQIDEFHVGHATDFVRPGNYNPDTFDSSVPHHVDRPPSPVVFARTLTRIKIADDVPEAIFKRAERRTVRNTLQSTAAKAMEDLLGETLGGILEDDSPVSSPRMKSPHRPKIKRRTKPFSSPRVKRNTSDLPSAVTSPISNSTTPIHAQRQSSNLLQDLYYGNGSDGLKNNPRYFDFKSQKRKENEGRVPAGEPVVHAATGRPPRYGAWYIPPKKWTVGMMEVLNDMATKQQGSWGVEMAAIRNKSEELQAEIPNLFIGKQFKRELTLKGDRVPHFLDAVALGEDADAIGAGVDASTRHLDEMAREGVRAKAAVAASAAANV